MTYTRDLGIETILIACLLPPLNVGIDYSWIEVGIVSSFHEGYDYILGCKSPHIWRSLWKFVSRQQVSTTNLGQSPHLKEKKSCHSLSSRLTLYIPESQPSTNIKSRHLIRLKAGNRLRETRHTGQSRSARHVSFKVLKKAESLDAGWARSVLQRWTTQ